MQERAIRTRRAILLTAAEMFEQRGYTPTRLHDIAELNNMSKGALYFHFQSKEALALAVVKEHIELWENLAARLRQVHSRALRIFLELSWETARLSRSDLMMRASLRLFTERSMIGATMGNPFKNWIRVATELLDEAKMQGDVAAHVHCPRMAKFMVASFVGFQQIASQGESRDNPRDCVNILWQCVLPIIASDDIAPEMIGLVQA